MIVISCNIVFLFNVCSILQAAITVTVTTRHLITSDSCIKPAENTSHLMFGMTNSNSSFEKGKGNCTFQINQSNFTLESNERNSTFATVDKTSPSDFDVLKLISNSTMLHGWLKEMNATDDVYRHAALNLATNYVLIRTVLYATNNMLFFFFYFLFEKDEHELKQSFLNYTHPSLDTAKIKRIVCVFALDLDTAIDREYMDLLDVMKFYVGPSLALFALCQNILVIAIVKLDGIKKTTNILLLAVILASSLQLFLPLNLAEKILYQIYSEHRQQNEFGCIQYNNTGLQFFKHIFIFIGTWGQLVFLSLLMLITTERLLAVFLPMKIKTIVTRRAVACSVLLAFIFWLPCAAFKTLCLYLFDVHAFTMEEMMKRAYLLRFFLFERELGFFILSKLLPLVFVTTGNVTIIIGLRIALARRKRLTSGSKIDTRSTRTTKTLLLTCLVLSVFEVFYFLLAFLVMLLIDDTLTSNSLQSELISLSFVVSNFSILFIVIFSNRKLFHKIVEYASRLKRCIS
ncbi:G-protein coupled receptor [Biomphalaria glabrata]|nr:G-protein coupled receptor [Biomphalaria glabrata]